MPRSILSYFKGEPRPVQKKALLELEANWDKADVFVVSLSVGSGKSRVAACISEWVKSKSVILTPTNLLVDQYRQDFPKLFTLPKKTNFICDELHGATSNCADYKQLKGRHCSNCSYLQAQRTARTVRTGVYNYYTYMAHRLYTPTVIIDEAHGVLDLLRDLNSKKIWKHQWDYPGTVTSYGSLYRWVNDVLRYRKSKVLTALKEDLENNSLKYIVSRTSEYYRGEDRDCIKLTPVDVRNESPVFWPPDKVKKLVLMSGTINHKDIYDMGLDKKRIHYVDLPSPIDPERRPVCYTGSVNMSYRTQNDELPKLVNEVVAFMSQNEGKGLIHAPYSLAEKLKRALPNDERLMFHDRENKGAQYKLFRETMKPRVFVASGLYEGVDLAGDDFTWQLITKVPYPSLAEPAIKYKAETDHLWYSWTTIKTVLQACGRICRGPTDYGATYVLDKCWERLYIESNNNGLIPTWWSEAYKKEM